MEYDGIGAGSTTADCRLPPVGWRTWRLKNLDYDGIGARSSTADCRLPLVGDPFCYFYQFFSSELFSRHVLRLEYDGIEPPLQTADFH